MERLLNSLLLPLAMCIHGQGRFVVFLPMVNRAKKWDSPQRLSVSAKKGDFYKLPKWKNIVLDVFGRFSASFALPSWTIACYAPAKLSQNLLGNQSKSIPS